MMAITVTQAKLCRWYIDVQCQSRYQLTNLLLTNSFAFFNANKEITLLFSQLGPLSLTSVFHLFKFQTKTAFHQVHKVLVTDYFFNFFSPSKVHFRRKSEVPNETPEELLRLPRVRRSYVAVKIIVINIKLIIFRKNHF